MPCSLKFLSYLDSYRIPCHFGHPLHTQHERGKKKQRSSSADQPHQATGSLDQPTSLPAYQPTLLYLSHNTMKSALAGGSCSNKSLQRLQAPSPPSSSTLNTTEKVTKRPKDALGRFHTSSTSGFHVFKSRILQFPFARPFSRLRLTLGF